MNSFFRQSIEVAIERVWPRSRSTLARSAEEVQRRANFNRNLVDRILHSVYDVLCTHTGSRAHRRQLAQLHDGVNELKLPLNTFARRNRS